VSEKIDRPKNKDLSQLKSILHFMKPYKLQIILAGFFLIFTTIVTLSLGQGLRLLIDKGFQASTKEELSSRIIIFFIIGVGISIGTFFRHYLVSWIGEKVSADIRETVFQKVIFLEPNFFETNLSSEIQTRITTDTAILQSVVGSSVSIALRNLLMFVGGIIWLFYTNSKLTLIILSSIPFVVFPILFYGKKVRNLSKKSQDQISNVGVYVSETLSNIKLIQSFNHEKVDINKFHLVSKSALDTAVDRVKQRSYLIAIVILLILFGISFMLYIGGIDVIEGRITGGELAAFAFYSIIISSSVGAISEVLGDLQRAAGASERLMELYHTKPTIENTESGIIIKKSELKKFEITGLNFSYPSRKDIPAIQEFSHEFQLGKTTAIVGPSGAGKSTIFDLILRFYDPSSGKISINGINISELQLDHYRKLFSIVPQNPNLFSTSILENLKLSKPDASMEEVETCCKQAQIYDMIMGLPDRWDTFVGDSGIRLSGGQKQRVAIARALLKDPAILLLDEATSALDSENEQLVQKALEEISKTRTMLVIAHRLSTVIHSDHILVMDKGKIVGKGNHNDLIKSNELYQRLAKIQFLNAETSSSESQIS
jgi:ATP-binding cassette subfamily B protein